MKALISVSDKTGVVELSHELTQLGCEIISTGGTAKALQQAEIPTIEVSSLTGFPEILSGRVKTLHPNIFGGILSIRSDARHRSEMAEYSIPYIDWVIVDLYPFEKMSMEEKISKSEMIEFIDIGGVALLRAAAKNFQDVVVICDPKDYAWVLQEFKENKEVSIKTKKALALKVFTHTAHYDSMIAKFFSRSDVLISHSEKPIKTSSMSEPFPRELTIGLRKISDLRYGENPQQKASLYKESGERDWGVVNAEKLQGKELSFNNYIDLDSAWQIVNALSSEIGRAHV
jgi:phosphoribosylaminoimidazolecarboxamide formyltransferase / IMP cyclohydrolase